MKSLITCLVALCATLSHAETTEAWSEVFGFDTRDSVGSWEAFSGVFSMDARDLGNAASEASGSFALNTFGTVPTGLEITGPASLAAGSAMPYAVKWNQTGNVLDVTSEARWRFIGSAPGNTGMVPPTLYAGQTSVPAKVTLVASYLGPAGVSVETPPFTVTIVPALGAATTTTRGTGGQVTFSAVPRDASGSTTIRWDLDGNGVFDDAIGESASQDYGIWTGSTSVRVEVTDAAGNRHVEQRDIVLNKPLAANQPIVPKPAYDPGGFKLGLAAEGTPTPFVFNSGGIDRRSSGLVVIVHGLASDYNKRWLTNMAQGIEDRCAKLGMDPPNIALLDWSELAKDPSELEEWQKILLKSLVEKGIRSGNLKALGTGAAGLAINFVFDAYFVRDFGLITGQQLASWIYQNSTLGGSPQINAAKSIHLIGHSAGGFVAGEAARILKHLDGGPPVITVDRVTMLDTPFPLASHFRTGGKNYAGPGTADQFVSSFYGTLPMPFVSYPNPHQWFRHRIVGNALNVFNFSTGDGGHGYSHVWYRDTIWQDDFSSDGFALSPIINPATRAPREASLNSLLALDSTDRTVHSFEPAPHQNGPHALKLPSLVPTGWQTFGNATENSGTWTFYEQADAGIWTDLTMPLEAGSLKFDFHFTDAGNGDFLAVHFGDLPVLFRGLDLPLSRDGWLPMEIPLDLVTATTGKLIFTLVSRGNPNASVQVRNIQITQSDDPDSDGLTVTQEQTLGTDPRNSDSDGDGLTDGNEANLHFTDALATDTDGDGQNDASELAAGTDPIQSGSVFRVTRITRLPNGSMSFEWPGVAGKRYRVMRSQEIGTGNFEILAVEVAGTGAPIEFVDPNPPAPRGFYWVELN